MRIRDFTEIWCLDFEFKNEEGGSAAPLCLVACELNSGKIIRLWRDELLRMAAPPFSGGPDSLIVAYYATAEMRCFLELGWQPPECIVDLYAEFRCLTNGTHLPQGSGLIGALSYFGMDVIESSLKDSMRTLALEKTEWGSVDCERLLDYCQSDVLPLRELLGRLVTDSSLPYALIRGHYTIAAASMEKRGIPIDLDTYRSLENHRDALRLSMIQSADRPFGVYEGTTFKASRFLDWVLKRGIPWPRKEGRALLDKDIMKEMANIYPELRPLKELRNQLNVLRKPSLAVGPDARNRTMLSVFRSRTGRNQPSNSKFIFGLPSAFRALIRPPQGRALAYIDFEQQEFAIAAALSGDANMIRSYQSGDPYLEFGRLAGIIPANGTKQSHLTERELCKQCILATQYGMGAPGLARRLQRTEATARSLLDKHRRVYRRFWEWSDQLLEYALYTRKLQTVLGWQVQLRDPINERSIRNFPMQANGAEMLRLACIFAFKTGLELCAPVHDAILIEADADAIECAVGQMQRCMRWASEEILGGFRIRVDAQIIRYPETMLSRDDSLIWASLEAIVSERAQSEQSREPSRRCTVPAHSRSPALSNIESIDKEDRS